MFAIRVRSFGRLCTSTERLIRWLQYDTNEAIVLNSSSIFSSPFLSESRTFAPLVRNGEASLQIVNDALDDELTELFPPEA